MIGTEKRSRALFERRPVIVTRISYADIILCAFSIYFILALGSHLLLRSPNERMDELIKELLPDTIEEIQEIRKQNPEMQENRLQISEAIFQELVESNEGFKAIFESLFEQFCQENPSFDKTTARKFLYETVIKLALMAQEEVLK